MEETRWKTTTDRLGRTVYTARLNGKALRVHRDAYGWRALVSGRVIHSPAVAYTQPEYAQAAAIKAAQQGEENKP